MTLPLLGTRRDETLIEFHRRMIVRCEELAVKHELVALQAGTPVIRANALAKAAKDRRNAALHRQRLSDALSSGQL